MYTFYQPEPFMSQMEQLEQMERLGKLDDLDGELAELEAAEAELAQAEAELDAASAEREAAEAEMQAAQAEMEAAQAEMACAKAAGERDNRLVTLIEEALIADSLITDTQHYSFSFNDKSLTVNGKKQSEAMWEKYKDLITSNSDYRISKRFHFSVSKNGKQMTTSINN
jgi:bla regulator protein blaR1